MDDRLRAMATLALTVAVTAGALVVGVAIAIVAIEIADGRTHFCQ
jgi:hypothetical protein